MVATGIKPNSVSQSVSPLSEEPVAASPSIKARCTCPQCLYGCEQHCERGNAKPLARDVMAGILEVAGNIKRSLVCACGKPAVHAAEGQPVCNDCLCSVCHERTAIYDVSGGQVCDRCSDL